MDTTLEPTLSRTASNAITAGIAVACSLLALLYATGLYFLYRYLQKHPRAINKIFNIHLQRYVPASHLFLLVISLLEMATITWLLAQYAYTGRFSNIGTRIGLQVGLFSACWTFVTCSLYIVIFVHPTFSEKPVASLGLQAIWILLTWSFWVSATATMNRALPLLDPNAKCAGAEYCSQIQASFAFALINVLTLTIGMIMIAWLTWRVARISS